MPTETGLEGVLFSMLDKETDQRLLSNIHDTLISMLHELSGKDLARWLTLCKTVLSASKGSCLISDKSELCIGRIVMWMLQLETKRWLVYAPVTTSSLCAIVTNSYVTFQQPYCCFQSMNLELISPCTSDSVGALQKS